MGGRQGDLGKTNLTAKRGGEFLNRETRGTREREKAETDLTAKNTENAKHSGIINRR
jgi:hypothetical protein